MPEDRWVWVAEQRTAQEVQWAGAHERAGLAAKHPEAAANRSPSNREPALS
jgi:hypothetical protein